MRLGKLALVAAALVLVAGVIAGCRGDDSGSAAEAAEPAAPPAASAPAEPEAAAPAPAEEPAAPAPPAEEPAEPTEQPPADAPGEAAPQVEGLSDDVLGARTLAGESTRVIRTAEMSIGVDPRTFDVKIDQARAIAAGFLGFVTNSSRQVYDEQEKLVSGSITVRVPGERYADVMQQYTELGRVETRTEHGQDVSREFVDLQARRRHLQAVERRLLGFLDDTTTINDALKVQGRVNEVQLQLEQIRGQLRFLEDQTSFSTITLTVTERDFVAIAKAEREAKARADEQAAAKEKAEEEQRRAEEEALLAEDDTWGPLDAWRVAADGFLAVVGGALVVLATAGPIVAVLGLAFVGWRLLRRRRLEQTSEPAQAAGPTAG